MRKKSHISLAGYLLNSEGMELLKNHKKSLYFGSILPDCVPSFFTRKHTIDETFEILEKEIRKITEDYDITKGIGRYYCRHLGVITHYIADYFTFPHNRIYDGNIKEHCIYEKHLKYALKNYVQSEEAQKIREKNGIFQTVDDICKFIKDMHEKYLDAIKIIEIDCVYIVELCHRVVDAILQFVELQLEQSKIAIA